jgi:hypothetical protein
MHPFVFAFKGVLGVRSMESSILHHVFLGEVVAGVCIVDMSLHFLIYLLNFFFKSDCLPVDLSVQSFLAVKTSLTLFV